MNTVAFESKDPLSAEQLQHLLRQDFNGDVLRNAVVTESSSLTPWLLKITGAFAAYGKLRAYEADIDARNIKSADDLLKLVGGLNTSFDEAAEVMKNEGL